MNQQPHSIDSSQINLLKNLDDIDDIFNGLAQDDGAQLDQDFEDFLECFSDDEDSEEESNYRPFPSFRNVTPSVQFSTFAESDQVIKKQTEERLLAPSGDHQFPVYDDQQQEDSVDEGDDLSDFFDSFDINNTHQNKEDEVNYIEIKYFDETYKIPIFTAKLFEPEQPLEDRLLFENTELVLSKTEMHDFHKHLERILTQDQKNFNDFTFSVMIQKIQSALLADLLKSFQKMKDFQQVWLDISPSFICQEKVTQFGRQLKQFQESVNYVIDSNSNKITSRRFFDKQKPAYFQDKKKDNKKKEMTEEEKILELQQIPYNQNFIPQSSLVSILFFKAQALFESWLQFLHHKKNSEKYKEISNRFIRLYGHWKTVKLLKHFANFIAKTKSIYMKPLKGEDQQQDLKEELKFYQNFLSMKTLGIVNNLTKSTTLNIDGGKFKVKSLNQIKVPLKQKYISQQYLNYTQELL
ncbi:unnamed protein product [Paramecium pentaurelia]|uniref:Uncharacterized protein n=1 Tax=Paramecium pentaurelia TaxID=43138 RepID=A0A8S1T679_9CILI|nr:unnamed protein product [Paramecium pentaurelia]